MLPFDPPRLASSVHYVIARTEPNKLGYVKLNKVLWYSDLEHYRRRGESLTGLKEYTRMPQGPMSKDISRAIRFLRKEGMVAERPVKVIDYTRRELVWLKEPDISGFDAEQIDILSRVIDFIAPMTADEVSRTTHQDALWKELKDNDAMPIGAGSIVARPPNAKQLAWALAQARH